MNNRDSPRAIDYPHHGVDHIAHIMSIDGHRSYKIHSNPFYLDRELLWRIYSSIAFLQFTVEPCVPQSRTNFKLSIAIKGSPPSTERR